MKVSDVYQSSWLKADDLQGAARRVRIADVTIEEFKQQDGTKEKKLVASFMGKQKKLVLNRTNAAALTTIFGSDDTEEWQSGEILLAPGVAPNGKATINVSAIPSEGDSDEPF